MDNVLIDPLHKLDHHLWSFMGRGAKIAMFSRGTHISLVLSTRFILHDQHAHQNVACPNFTMVMLFYRIWSLLCTFQVLCAYNSGQNVLYMKRRSKRTQKFEIVLLNKFSCILQETNTILKDMCGKRQQEMCHLFIF